MSRDAFGTSLLYGMSEQMFNNYNLRSYEISTAFEFPFPFIRKEEKLVFLFFSIIILSKHP